MRNLKILLLTVVLVLCIPQISNAQNYFSYNWSRLPFDSDAYIDNSKISGDKIFGFKVLTLYTFNEISSAQMFGLSEIRQIEINCQKATMRDLKSIWTEKKMGGGKITDSSGPHAKFSIMNVLDGTFERKLFAHICK